VPGLVVRSIFLVFVLVSLVLVFPQVVSLVLLILLVVIIAIPLARAGTWLERLRLPRYVGVPLTLILALAVFGGVIALLVPSFVSEGRELVKGLPGTVQSLQHKLSPHSHTSFGASLQKWVNGYTGHPQKLLGPATQVGATLAGIVSATVAVLLTAVFTAIRPEPLIGGLLRLAPPPRRADLVRLFERLSTAYVGWLRGLIVAMVALWLVTFAGLELIGLKYAVVFATLTAIACVVPYFGALVSSVPPIAYALTISPGKAVLVAVVYLVAHFVEGDLISPLVMSRAVRIPPALVAVGVLAVERLFGFAGLLVAVPIIVTVKLAVEELWVRPMEAAYAWQLDTGPSPESTTTKSKYSIPYRHDGEHDRGARGDRPPSTGEARARPG
jgi:predicted PurR-regulated permease PerM